MSWKIFPPIGEFNEDAEEISSNTPVQHFKNLKMIELRNLARLKRWVVGQLLPHLEVVIIEHCHELVELSFSNFSCSPRVLQELRIANCPKLLSLPPIPWTPLLSASFPYQEFFLEWFFPLTHKQSTDIGEKMPHSK